MSSKLYVGNLSFQTREDGLEQIFAQYGEVKSVKIITDRETGRSRGFGFVEMSSADEAQEAMSNLDGKDADGRNIRVSIAKEKEPRKGGGNFGGGGGKRW